MYYSVQFPPTLHGALTMQRIILSPHLSFLRFQERDHCFRVPFVLAGMPIKICGNRIVSHCMDFDGERNGSADDVHCCVSSSV